MESRMGTSVIGQPISRIDGPRKVTGTAPYAVEHAIENVAYGAPVASTVGSGRVTRIDTSTAEKMPGVLGIIHHGNVEPMYRPAQGFEHIGSRRRNAAAVRRRQASTTTANTSHW